SAATILAALIVTAGATACSGVSSTSGDGGGISIQLIDGLKSDPFYISMVCGATAEAKAKGASLSVTGPDAFDVSQQLPLLNAAVARNPQALIIVPDDPSALSAPLTQAKNAGSKIITAD